MRYAPQHNWTAYEEALKRNPVLAKMVISGVVYSVGDWIAQVSPSCEISLVFVITYWPLHNIICLSFFFFNLYPWILQCFEGKPLFEFDRIRMFRSGLVGFTLHGSLSHYYYQFCEVNIMFFFFLVLGLHISVAWFTLTASSLFTGTFSFPGLVGGSCQSNLWPNCMGGNLEQYLFYCLGIFATWIPS